MTSSRESRAKALNALAALIHEIRPEWDTPGIVAALRRCPDDLALGAITIAAARYADDASNTTPAHLGDFGNRAWDSDWHTPCKTHPETRARRTDGECAACWTDRHAALRPLPLRNRGVPPAPDVRRQLVAAMRVTPSVPPAASDTGDVATSSRSTEETP